MKKTITFDSISSNRLSILKTLLKSFYMGEYMPPVEVIQGEYDHKLDPNTPVYKPGEIASCTVTEHINWRNEHILAAHIKHADPRICSYIDHWRLENMNKWIEAE
jgi:hypothetical protein